MSHPENKILLTGSCGMLSGHLLDLFSSRGISFIATDVAGARVRNVPGTNTEHPIAQVKSGFEILDITNLAELNEIVAESRPSWIINTAAYTAVDHAEKDYDAAFRVNAVGPKNLALCCAKFGIKLVHVSSDYVFGGHHLHVTPGENRLRVPFGEEEPFAPCGLYGHSKRFGDELVQACLPENHLIVRTSWLHGLYGPNFVDTILAVSAEKKELRVVNDQKGSPTWAGYLAEMILELIEREARGTYHVSSRGNISWFDLANEIIKSAGRSAVVAPQSSAELNREAPRPPFSTLDVRKLETFSGRPAPAWRTGVHQHLAQRGLLKNTSSETSQ